MKVILITDMTDPFFTHQVEVLLKLAYKTDEIVIYFAYIYCKHDMVLFLQIRLLVLLIVQTFYFRLFLVLNQPVKYLRMMNTI